MRGTGSPECLVHCRIMYLLSVLKQSPHITQAHPRGMMEANTGFTLHKLRYRFCCPFKMGTLSAVLVIQMTKQAAASSMCNSLHSRSPFPVLIFRLVNSSNCCGAFQGPSSWVSAVERVPLHPCSTKLPL